jgi:hypothetical protein
LPSGNDVSGQELLGPQAHGESGGNNRELKLPVMYFDSNDEMFFEDEDL